MKRYQFVWWRCWRPYLWFVRLDPKKSSLAYIYEWSLYIGWLEIRKWSKNVYDPEGRRRRQCPKCGCLLWVAGI